MTTIANSVCAAVAVREGQCEQVVRARCGYAYSGMRHSGRACVCGDALEIVRDSRGPKRSICGFTRKRLGEFVLTCAEEEATDGVGPLPQEQARGESEATAHLHEHRELLRRVRHVHVAAQLALGGAVWRRSGGRVRSAGGAGEHVCTPPPRTEEELRRRRPQT